MQKRKNILFKDRFSFWKPYGATEILLAVTPAEIFVIENLKEKELDLFCTSFLNSIYFTRVFCSVKGTIMNHPFFSIKLDLNYRNFYEI